MERPALACVICRTTLRVLATVLLLSSVLPFQLARAYTDQWKWTINAQEFDSKRDAMAYMRSLLPTGPYMTIEEIVTVQPTSVTYKYTAPMRAGEALSEWGYFSGAYGGGSFATEAQLIAYIMAQWPPDDPQCPASTYEPAGEWSWVSSFYGQVSTRERRPYSARIYTRNSQGYCDEHATTGSIYRDRMAGCPSPYGASAVAPHCKITGSFQISGRPLASACVANISGREGNPCDVATGDKTLEETDYSAGSLKFSRTYHSQSLETRSKFGVGWVHNFDGRFILNSTLAGLARPSGVHEYLRQVATGRYVSEASGLQVRKLGTEWHVYLPSGEREIYNATGRLIRLISEAGQITELSYLEGRLARVIGPFGHELQFGYDDDRLVTVTTPDNTAINYEYDFSGNLAAVVYPDGTRKDYHYEDPAFPNHLTGISDQSGARFATYAYDSIGRVVSSEHAGGAGQVSLDYQATSTIVTNALGLAKTYTFTSGEHARKIAGVSYGGSSETFQIPSYSTDTQRRPSQRTDRRGVVTRFTYDADHLTSKTEAFGTALAQTTSYQYLSTETDQPTQITDLGKTTTFTYDTGGRVLTRTVLDTATSESRTWTYTYNSFGQVLAVDGPRTDVADVTTYAYYTCTTGSGCGQIQTITNAAGHVTTYNTYDAHGQPLTITDPNGVVTTLVYDLRQRLTSRTVGSETTTFSYWPTGLLKRATLPDGSCLEYTYDDAQRLTDINDAEGNRIHYTLDAMGNRTGEQAYDPSNALVRTRTRVFDTLSRLQEEIGAAGTANVTTTYGYDNNDNQTNIAAPLGRDTNQGYDELNRLTSVTDPLTGVTQYGYNALDQLISVTDPRGLLTSYSYNALGDLKQQASPDTGVTTNTYDSSGNLATSTDARNSVTTYTYDALNRVATAAYSAGSSTDQALTYTYDTGAYGKGHLTGVSDANHSLAWTYDDQGRVLTAAQTVGSISKTTSYTYANGLRQSMTTPSGQVITYGYTNGKITSINVNGTVVVSGILYDPFGPVRQWTWADGSLAVRTFDQDGNIALIDSAGLKTYSYDDAFRVTGITDTTNSALSWTYGYDDLDRLTSAAKTGTTLGYTYDANGNRLTETGSNASTFTIAANSNRLSSTSGALSRTYGYDDAGNATSFAGISFTYNNRGRMSSSTKNGVTISYVYNALGQLVKKAGSALYYYDEAGHILGIYDDSGALTEEIVWLGDTPVATLRPQSGGGVHVYNVHTDHLNTPRVITDAVSAVVRWRWDGEPFGGGAVNDDPSGAGSFVFSLRFPGQIAMTETGLYYNYYRDYDPSTGRYVQGDPIGLEGGINTYAYVGGNPISRVDPNGLQVVIPLPVPPPPVPGTRNPGYPSDGGLGDIIRAVGDEITRLVCFSGGQCPPCKTISGKIVAVGTIGYRPLDVIPDNVKQHGVYGSHHNLFKANQMPFPNCDCFWQKLKDVAKPDQLQPSWIAIEPFVN